MVVDSVDSGETLTVAEAVVERVGLAVGTAVTIMDSDAVVVEDNRLVDNDDVWLPKGVAVEESKNVSERVAESDGVGGEDLVSEGEMLRDVLEVKVPLTDTVAELERVGDAVQVAVGGTLRVEVGAIVAVELMLDVDDSDGVGEGV